MLVAEFERDQDSNGDGKLVQVYTENNENTFCVYDDGVKVQENLNSREIIGYLCHCLQNANWQLTKQRMQE